MKQSAGILAYRRRPLLEFFLVHPGGPIWAKKDLGAWSIPKGEFTDEDPLEAARREFLEETGQPISGDFHPLGSIVQASGKKVFAWAVEADPDPAAIVSNNFEMEWPPKSGQRREFPEVDRAEWFSAEAAIEKINPAQATFIVELARLLRG